MATYKIKFVSQTNAAILIVILLTVFFSCIALFAPHGIQNRTFLTLIITASGIVAYFSWQRFVTGRTEWTIDSREVNITWTRKFPFTGGEGIVLKWEDVKKISKGIEPQYYNLKIELVTGQIIRFYHDSMTTGDDFEECLKSLLQMFDQKNPAFRVT